MDYNSRRLSFPLGFWVTWQVACYPGSTEPPDNSQLKFDNDIIKFDNSASTWDGTHSPPPDPVFFGFLHFDQVSQSGAALFIGLV